MCCVMACGDTHRSFLMFNARLGPNGFLGIEGDSTGRKCLFIGIFLDGVIFLAA